MENEGNCQSRLFSGASNASTRRRQGIRVRLGELGEEVLKAFPNASKGCHSVMMKNNEAYAKYVAEVESVDKNTKEVTLHMLDTKEKAFSKVVIAPKEGATVKIDGKDTPVAKLKKGDKVSFYIPHDRWGLYADPDSTPITIVSREDL
jgi:Cu/Ag efflux protein CusF